ncbi:CinA family protein [Natronorarus salvus]|uniref:CinA family protein n=1 Tax=Natronorarus salvus TaxID=3117733 RepID=UPI002F2668F3
MSDRIEARVGEVLSEREETVATAESCTGGLVCSLLTDVSGSSAYVDCGFVTYAYDAKREVLGVSRESLDSHGAVSEVVAREMAAGARDHADTIWAVSTTGIAGPDGGSEEKPVGTVWIGVAHAAPWGSEASFSRASRYRFDGDRLDVKRAAAEGALSELHAAIESVGRDGIESR